jgi:hypothetical protein
VQVVVVCGCGCGCVGGWGARNPPYPSYGGALHEGVALALRKLGALVAAPNPLLGLGRLGSRAVQPGIPITS